jgi:AraC family transcriptional regulator of adaptative response / DNA-3-methyladenine glycosylase II
LMASPATNSIRNSDRLYRQFLKRDPAFNGKFLTGVLSTGIYCLPSCPARRPLRENVRFFHTPEEARASGLRACQRCRPDWFYRGTEWHENLYQETIARILPSPATFPDVAAMARAAGLSRTALNDLFRDHAHESPGAFLRRVRVDHTAALIERGAKPAHAAAEAGFESASAFHQQFAARTAMTPAAYAALGHTSRFTLRLPPRYRRREILDFYARDPQSPSERVGVNELHKATLIDDLPALLEVTFEAGSARCRVEGASGYAGHRAIIRMLGLDADITHFERHFSSDPAIGPLISRQRGLRIPLTPSPWEAMAWAIMGQQISVKAAVSLRHALISTYGSEHPGGLRAHPAATAIAPLAAEDLRALGFSRSKAEYMIAAAKAVAAGELPLADWVASRGRVSALRAARIMSNVRGIGPWTVQYVFLRGFGFADCLPAGDAGLARGLERITGERPAEPAIREIMARFAPYRSLATCHVWASLKGDHE